MAKTIEVEAIVGDYTANAMHDRYEGGQFEIFDGTEIELVAPPAQRGRKRMIYHGSPPPEGSPWRRKGARIRFRIDKRDLTEAAQLFDGALDDLVVIEPR